MTISVSGGNTTYQAVERQTTDCSGAPTGTATVVFDSSGGVVSSSNYSSISYTCSPLSVVIHFTIGTATITL